jgi:dGTPase
VFVTHQEAMIAGAFDESLMSKVPSVEEIADIKRLIEEVVFPHRPVVEIEAAGFRVIGGLLDDFVSYSWEHPRSRRAEKILSLLPGEVRPLERELESDQYELLLRMAQYVAGMTDEFAIRTYRVLRGIELPTS